MTQYAWILIALFIIYFSIIRRRDFERHCRWLMRRSLISEVFRLGSITRFDDGNFSNELYLGEGQKWPHLTFWNWCEFQLLVKLPRAYSWPFQKYHLREKLTVFNSRLRKWKVLWVYLVLLWLAMKSRVKMDGMLDAESQLEIQLLPSWTKGLSFLCFSIKKRQK